MKITNIRTKVYKTKDGKTFTKHFCDVDGETKEIMALPNGYYALVSKEEKQELYKRLINNMVKGGDK